MSSPSLAKLLDLLPLLPSPTILPGPDRSGSFSAIVQIELTPEDVDDLVVTAMEGGINHWCESVDLSDYRDRVDEPSSVTVAGVLLLGKSVNFIVRDEDENLSLDDRTATLTLAKLVAGIQTYLTGLTAYLPLDRNRLDVGNIDAPAADVIFQFALFGEDRYA